MGPTWGRQDPGGSHVGPMNLAIWECYGQVISQSGESYIRKFTDTPIKHLLIAEDYFVQMQNHVCIAEMNKLKSLTLWPTIYFKSQRRLGVAIYWGYFYNITGDEGVEWIHKHKRPGGYCHAICAREFLHTDNGKDK